MVVYLDLLSEYEVICGVALKGGKSKSGSFGFKLKVDNLYPSVLTKDYQFVKPY